MLGLFDDLKKSGNGATPGEVQDKKEETTNLPPASALPVDLAGNPHPRHRRTREEMAAARAAGEPVRQKIICEHNDVPDMPTGVNNVRPGIRVNEAYPMIVRMLGENKDMIILYLRTLVLKAVYSQDQRAKEEYKYMKEYYKMEVIL